MQVKSKIGRIFEIPSAQEEMEIRRGITDDSEMGEVSDELLTQLRPVGSIKARKQAISIRLSSDVLDYFKATGADWQARVDEVLKAYVNSQKHRLG